MTDTDKITMTAGLFDLFYVKTILRISKIKDDTYYTQITPIKQVT